MVTVPAGTFKALRIERFERRSSEEYWWAPAVRMIIKIDTSKNWHAELIDYTLRDPKP